MQNAHKLDIALKICETRMKDLNAQIDFVVDLMWGPDVEVPLDDVDPALHELRRALQGAELLLESYVREFVDEQTELPF